MGTCSDTRHGCWMIDTLKVGTSVFTVGKKPRLTIVPYHIDAATRRGPQHILWVNGFSSVYGKKAFYKEPGIEVSVRPLTNHKPAYLIITIEPAKILWGDNFKAVSESEFKQCIEIVRSTLASIGIDVVLDECKVIHLDVFRNIELDHDVKHYISAMSLLSPKYMRRKPVTRERYYRRENSQNAICLYDKIECHREKKCMVPTAIGVSDDANIARLEHRALKPVSVTRQYDITFVEDMLTNNAFLHIESRFKTILEKSVFRFKAIGNPKIVIDTDAALFNDLLMKYGKKSAPDLFICHKLMMTSSDFSMDVWESLMGKAGLTAATIHKKKYQLYGALMLAAEMKHDPVLLSDLLGEIISKALT